jgi:hypothetical protein
LLEKCAIEKKSDETMKFLWLRVFESDIAWKKAKCDHARLVKQQRQRAKLQKRADEETAAGKQQMQSGFESQLTAKQNALGVVQERMTALQEMLNGVLRSCKQRSELQRKAARIEGLLERVRELGAGKIQMDRDWVAEMMEMCANRSTLESEAPSALHTNEERARIYNDGKNMGYLESMKDNDLILSQSGRKPQWYPSLNNATSHDYVGAMNHYQHPYNRDLEVSRSLIGAWAADLFEDTTLDERVYTVPKTTEEIMTPCRTHTSTSRYHSARSFNTVVLCSGIILTRPIYSLTGS